MRHTGRNCPRPDRNPFLALAVAALLFFLPYGVGSAAAFAAVQGQKTEICRRLLILAALQRPGGKHGDRAFPIHRLLYGTLK